MTALRDGTDLLPWHRPDIRDEDIAEVVDTLRSGWLTTGPKTELLETEVRALVGAEAAFAVTSCTAALHLALLAAGIGAGDEVITTGLTFCASVNVVAAVGAEPVLVDVEDDTLNIDPDAVRAAITARTKAVLVVHYAGHPADMHRLTRLAEAHGLLLFEDAAHAIGATYRGRPVGSFGDLAAFSFYANKVVTTGEGGMLVGRRDLVERARLIGRHGIDRPIWDRQGSRTRAYDVVLPGIKYNLSDVLAAIGLHQLRRVGELVDRRAALALAYTSRLRSVGGLVPPAVRADVRSAWHLYVVRVRADGTAAGRDAVAEDLRRRGVGTSVHFIPVHWFSQYRSIRRHDLPVTDRAGHEVLSLPCYPGLATADVTRVVDALRDALAAGPAAEGGAPCTAS
jgi:dTDP-4-amino-4,6-dideoxygalactose transaminase